MASEEFRNHVTYYTSARVSTTIYFPEDKVKCYYCRFLKYEHGLDRYRCLLTDEIIYSPHAPGLPDCCPARIEKG